MSNCAERPFDPRVTVTLQAEAPAQSLSDRGLAQHHPHQSGEFRWQVLRAIAGKEFCDQLRSGWVLGCILIWIGAVSLTSFLALLQIGEIGVQGYERTVTSLLSMVQWFVPLLGLLLGHDLLTSERENRTLALILATGVKRTTLLAGKLVGACLTLAVPLVLGFSIAGVVIAVAARDPNFWPYLKLGLSGIGLGILFLCLGLAVSCFSRTRVQALVLALLAWCFAVFAFDLAALAMLVSTTSRQAAQEIELTCDTTHVNAAADLHSAYDSPGGQSFDQPPGTATDQRAQGLGWLMLNPIDVFRAINLPPSEVRVQPLGACVAMGSWMALVLWAAVWKFNRTDAG